MAIWVVRAGSKGERQDFALDQGCVVIGWDNVPGIDSFADKAALRALLEEQRPTAKPRKIASHVGQLWKFKHTINVGDHVALPLKGQSKVAYGRISGEYEFHQDYPQGVKHLRKVEWINQEIPRSALPQDILNSLGTLLTISQIRAINAEARLCEIAAGNVSSKGVGGRSSDNEGDEVDDQLNLEGIANDEIREYLSQNFSGHGLADLVDAVLIAQGYQTQVSPPGPDGGVDIIAGRGPMGFDPPRLMVQVKVTKGSQPVKVLRELKGVMKDFNANQGLFVSWGGFSREAIKEARKSYFEVRLWDADDLVMAILRHYDQFSEALKAELPLKRIWTLVHEDE